MRHAGRELITRSHDDSVFPGGVIERPGPTRLIADIEEIATAASLGVARTFGEPEVHREEWGTLLPSPRREDETAAKQSLAQYADTIDKLLSDADFGIDPLDGVEVS